MPLTTPDSVVVSRSSFDSDEAYDIISSNISFVNALFGEYLRGDEIAPDALRSYYVDFYLAQVNNGGFSQFVYNCGWAPEVTRHVRDGLRAMKADEHLALFEQSAAIVDRLGADKLDDFLDSQYFGDNRERDILNGFNDAFFDLNKRHDLIEINAKWLRSLPNLLVMPLDEMEAEVQRRADSVPYREERIAQAKALAPRFEKLIDALCEEAGHTLGSITAGDPSHKHEGKPTLAWHFLTNHGHFYMVDAGDEAIMFDDSKQRVATIDATDEWFGE